ncbi:MAG: hypothetical protein QNJ40_23615 [Xanthomonadales bacterium]|nr:hypothetical protein [Xanthomonadales bacterium]
MTDASYSLWMFFGTYLPLIGIALTIVLAWINRGPTRAAALIVIPALTLIACWWLAEEVARQGPGRAFALYMSYVVTLVFYYPVLAVWWYVRYLRNRFGKASAPLNE